MKSTLNIEDFQKKLMALIADAFPKFQSPKNVIR